MSKQGGADFAIRRRIHFIFSRALNRFKGDERLWLQWIDFGQRRKADKRLERIYGRALSVLPRSVELWTRAAAWELEVRANSSAARRLLQRALRANRGERELWLAYFRFELIFAEKTRRRREALGIGAEEAADGTEQEAEAEADDGDDSSSEEAEEEDDVEVEDDEDEEEVGVEGEEEEGGELSDAESHAGSDGAQPVGVDGAGEGSAKSPWCAIAELVFEEAVGALRNDGTFQLGCLKMCLEFEAAAPLARAIEARVRRDFAADADVAKALANLQLARQPLEGWSAAHTAAVRQGVRSLEASVAAAPAAATWRVFGEWVEELLRRPALPAGLARRLHQRALKLCKSAHKAKAAAPCVYLRWAALHLAQPPMQWSALPPLADLACSPHAWRQLEQERANQQGSADAAAAAVRVSETGVQLYPQDAPLACLCLQLMAARGGGPMRLKDVAALREPFWTATRSMAGTPGAVPVWRLWVELALGAEDAVEHADAALEVWRQAAASLKHDCASLKVRPRPARTTRAQYIT